MRTHFAANRDTTARRMHQIARQIPHLRESGSSPAKNRLTLAIAIPTSTFARLPANRG
jgi:hypothetical protein